MKADPLKVLLLMLIMSLSFSTAAFGAAPNSEVLDRVVEVQTVGDYDEAEASRMVERLSHIPTSILNTLYKQGVEIKLINFALTDLPEYAHLKGVVPRGWEGTGLTWDDVPGLGGNPTVARIGFSAYGNGHTSINLELHELAHAIDSYVFSQISYSDEFTKLHAKEHDQFSTRPYFNYKEEYFAEAFAYYFLNKESNAQLKQVAPLTYQFIGELYKNIPSDNRAGPPVGHVAELN